MFDTLRQIIQPTIVGLVLDADVGVLVEHLHDGDELSIVFIVAVGMSKVRSMWCVRVWRTRVPDLIVEKLNPILSHVLKTVEDFPSVPGSVGVGVGQLPLHWGESVSRVG